MKIEVYKDVKNEWRWRLVSRNGQIVAVSGEGYINKQDALDILQTIIAKIGSAEIFFV